MPQGPRRRVLMLAACHVPASQGTGVAIAGLAQALGRAGHTVHLVSYGQAAKAPSAPRERAYVAHVPQHQAVPRRSGPHWRRLGADAALLRYAVALGQRHRFDLIHAHHIEGIALGTALRVALRIPLVGEIHTALAEELPSYFAGSYRAPMAYLGAGGDWASARFPDAVVALGAADAQRARIFRGRKGAERIFLIRPTCGALGLVPGATPRQRVRRAPQLIYSGNADGYQNLHLLAQAMHGLKERRPDIRLHLATHGPLAPLLSHPWPMGTSWQRVDGYAEMAQLLRGATVGVCPRAQPSGYPIKWLNYWHHGLTVVGLAKAATAAFATLQPNLGPAIWTACDPASFAAGLVQAVDGVQCTSTTEQAALYRDTTDAYAEVYARVLDDRARPRFSN